MVERMFRVMGWTCVVLGACAPVVAVARIVQGIATPWWEPLALVGVGATVVLVGLALALPNLGPRFVIVALSTWGAMLVAWGVLSLVVPGEVLVSRGRGPRTPAAARILGGTLLCLGGVLISLAVAKGRNAGRRRVRALDGGE